MRQLYMLLLPLLHGILFHNPRVEAVQVGEEVICYHTSWSKYRPGLGSFDVDDIDPFLCSTIIYGFIGINNVTWTAEVLDPWNDLCPEEGGNNCGFKRFVDLKQTNPDLITTVSVGGWNLGAATFSQMASDHGKRQTFINSTLEFIIKHGFDGVDIDWEYPAYRGGVPEDKENFVALMTEMRAEFDKFNPPLRLSVAAPAFKNVIEQGYDIPKLAPLFNRWHIMSYDYHGPWENRTHHNDPLCPYYLDKGDELYLNMMYSTKYYLHAGVPPEKLAMGIPTFGVSFTLDSTTDTGMLAPAHSPGPAGPYVGVEGELANYEICERLVNDSTCTVVKDPSLYEPYFWCSSDNIWVSYDDEESIYLKARNAKNLALAGVMVWSLDQDDFHGLCQQGPSHLIKTMKNALKEPSDGQITDCQIPTTMAPKETTMAPPQPSTTMAPPQPSTTMAPPQPSTTMAPQPATTIPPKPITTVAPPQPSTTRAPKPPTTMAPEPPTTVAPQPTTTVAPQPPTTVAPQPPTTVAPQPSTTMAPPQPSTTVAPPNPITTRTTTTRSETTTTQFVIETTTKDVNGRPDCTGLPDGTTFPHADCDKYWQCVLGYTVLEQCAPGTLWDENLQICNWEDQVDTSNCNYWPCQVDNTYYPHPDCDKYVWCHEGTYTIETCNACTFWNQNLPGCMDPNMVDTSECTIPDYCT